MAVKRKIKFILILGALCTGAASCSVLPDLLVEPFKPKSVSHKSQPRPQSRQICSPVTSREIVYIVRKGDTLGEIAQCFKTRGYDIVRRNKIKDPNAIEVGQRLIIPKRAYKVASTSKPGSSKKKQADTAKPVRPPSRVKSGIAWTWPVKGKIIRKFSPKGSGKQGISIAGKLGQKIVAAAPGKVVYSGEGLVGYGRLIIVQHKKDFLTAYAHNDRLLVKEGQSVKKGQTIAYMGKTAAKTPRLHFEMRYKGKPVNPLKYLP